MANTANIKNIPEIPSNPMTLTVVVLDSNNQPTGNARVSIKPSDASGVTNGAGEIQFKLGTATKYDITASYGSNTVTVPYYVTKGGATRLVVNPVYVRKIEKELHQPSWLNSDLLLPLGIGVGFAIILLVIWKFLKKRNRRSRTNKQKV